MGEIRPPWVQIKHPDEDHNNVAENFNVHLIASATDPNNDDLTYTIDWGDGENSNGNVLDNVINKHHSYEEADDYTVAVTVNDGEFTDSDSVEIKVWPWAFNITNLKPYDEPDFTNENYVFYRDEALYIKFNVIHKYLGYPVANNINHVYIYNRDTPSNIYDLTAFDGVAAGIKVDDGQPEDPDGSYYYYMPNLPISDDILGWNVVFVFTYDGAEAGQAELEIQILNNPLQLLDFPEVVLNQVLDGYIYKDLPLNDFVIDLDTPPEEIAWIFSEDENVNVNVMATNTARFYALQT